MTVLTQTPSRAACFLAALFSLPDAAAIYEGTEPYDTLTNTSGSCENAKGPVDAALSTGFVNCSCIDPNDGDANATANFVTTQGADLATYGKSFCQAWDVNTTDCDGAACPSSDGGRAAVGSAAYGNQQWCQNAWCYVDMHKCSLQWSLSGYFPGTMRAYSYAACGEINSYPHHGLGEYGVNGLRGKTLRVSYRRSSGGWRGGYHNDGKGRLDPMPTDGWYGPVMDLAQQFATDAGVTLQIVDEPDPAYERCFYGGSPCTSSWDMCVYGVSVGHLDMCIGAFVINQKRSSWAQMMTFDAVRAAAAAAAGSARARARGHRPTRPPSPPSPPSALVARAGAAVPRREHEHHHQLPRDGAARLLPLWLGLVAADHRLAHPHRLRVLDPRV